MQRRRVTDIGKQGQCDHDTQLSVSKKMIIVRAITTGAVLAVALVSGISSCAAAQSAQSFPKATPSANVDADREAVRRAALDYIEGFYDGDSLKLVRSVRPEVLKLG